MNEYCSICGELLELNEVEICDSCKSLMIRGMI